MMSEHKVSVSYMNTVNAIRGFTKDFPIHIKNHLENCHHWINIKDKKTSCNGRCLTKERILIDFQRKSVFAESTNNNIPLRC